MKRGNIDGIAVYVPKLKKMAAKIKEIKTAFIFDLFRQPPDTTSSSWGNFVINENT
jgi:hypothetical protein